MDSYKMFLQLKKEKAKKMGAKKKQKNKFNE